MAVSILKKLVQNPRDGWGGASCDVFITTTLRVFVALMRYCRVLMSSFEILENDSC